MTCVLVLFAALAASAAAATTHDWTLVKSGHGGPLNTRTIKGASGFAVSVTYPGRARVEVNWQVSCQRGSEYLSNGASFFSRGLGDKIPMKILMPKPRSCSVQVYADPGASSPFSVSVWRR